MQVAMEGPGVDEAAWAPNHAFTLLHAMQSGNCAL